MIQFTYSRPSFLTSFAIFAKNTREYLTYTNVAFKYYKRNFINSYPFAIIFWPLKGMKCARLVSK